jgi:membrane fusion protein, multidrug efflux system
MTTYMRLTALVLVALTACQQPDKKAELAALKVQKQELEAQIKNLEKELGKTTSEKPQTKIMTVAVSPLVATNFKHFIEVQGAVEATNTAAVSPQMGGVITSMTLKEGDAVAKGQLIATIDNSVLKESIEEVKHQLDLANTIFQKQKNLWDQQIGTEVQYLQAKANKEGLEKRIATLQAQLSMTKVFAPISGTVEMVRQKAGEMGMPGAPIVQLISVGNLRVKAKVADTYVSSVRRGNRLTVKFPDTNQEISATISVVSKMVNPITRTFDIEANIPNVGGQLKPNQLAVIQINDQSKPNALVINQNLVQTTDQGALVYVVEESNGKRVARARKVTLGLTYNGEVEVLSGLRSGDSLITDGYQELTDGQEIAF